MVQITPASKCQGACGRGPPPTGPAWPCPGPTPTAAQVKLEGFDPCCPRSPPRCRTSSPTHDGGTPGSSTLQEAELSLLVGGARRKVLSTCSKCIRDRHLDLMGRSTRCQCTCCRPWSSTSVRKHGREEGVGRGGARGDRISQASSCSSSCLSVSPVPSLLPAFSGFISRGNLLSSS